MWLSSGSVRRRWRCRQQRAVLRERAGRRVRARVGPRDALVHTSHPRSRAAALFVFLLRLFRLTHELGGTFSFRVRLDTLVIFILFILLIRVRLADAWRTCTSAVSVAVASIASVGGRVAAARARAPAAGGGLRRTGSRARVPADARNARAPRQLRRQQRADRQRERPSETVYRLQLQPAATADTGAGGGAGAREPDSASGARRARRPVSLRVHAGDRRRRRDCGFGDDDDARRNAALARRLPQPLRCATTRALPARLCTTFLF